MERPPISAFDPARPGTLPERTCRLASRTGTAVEWRATEGLAGYADSVAEMERRVDEIGAGTASELIWLVEHPPLYTAGTSARDEDLLQPGRLPVHRSGRGGRYTYHGPGQRVAYAMLNLADRGRDVRCFVSYLEDWIIATLAEVGVAGERRDGRVGVWVPASGDRPEAKIAAIGVRVRRWVTFHGLSINVAPNLGDYAGIVPCGATGFGVTSLADLGIAASMADVDAALRRTFTEVFGDVLTARRQES
jgi:lipoyl(octanoyl) transferase